MEKSCCTAENLFLTFLPGRLCFPGAHPGWGKVELPLVEGCFLEVQGMDSCVLLHCGPRVVAGLILELLEESR